MANSLRKAITPRSWSKNEFKEKFSIEKGKEIVNWINQKTFTWIYCANQKDDTSTNLMLNVWVAIKRSANSQNLFW